MTGERLQYILDVGKRAREGERYAALAAELGEADSFIDVCSGCYRGFQILTRQDPDLAEKALSGETQLRQSKLRYFKDGDSSEELVMMGKDYHDVNHAQLLEREVEIGKYSFQHGIQEAAAKYDTKPKDVVYKRAIYRGYSRLEGLIPNLGEKVESGNINLTSVSCRDISFFTDDAAKDAADALLRGGRISKTAGIVWPDGRTRPIEDCRTSGKKKQPEKKARPAPKPKTSSEELAELIAGAVGTFDASIERYVSDYPDASKEEAVRELQKAQEIITAWIGKLTLNE